MGLDIENRWKIKKGAYRCTGCERDFTAGDRFLSALFETETELQRRDYCDDCRTPEIRKNAFSFWETRMPDKDEKKKVLVDDEIIFNLFERFIEDENERNRRFGFILSLILMRKKKLKFEDISRREGKDYMILRQAGSDRKFHVEDPHLDNTQILEVKEELAKVVELPQQDTADDTQ